MMTTMTVLMIFKITVIKNTGSANQTIDSIKEIKSQ